MGKKRNKIRRHLRLERHFSNSDPTSPIFDCEVGRKDAKSKSKLSKKLKKKMLKQQWAKDKEERQPETRGKGGFHMVTVSVKESVKLDKNFLVTSIGNFVDTPFCPLGYFRDSDSVTFYFDSDFEVADAIRGLDKRIQSPSGELMGMKVTFVRETDFILNCEQLELVKCVMVKRFCASSGLLNLSCFHKDDQFIATDTFVPLSNNRILKQVCLIIKNNFNGITALDLSNNKLSESFLKQLEILEPECSSLFALNLEDNFIYDLSKLKVLKVFPLKELKITENGAGEAPMNYMKRAKLIRNHLPFLKVLNGLDLDDVKAKAYPDILASAHLSVTESDSISPLKRDSINAGVALTEEKIKTYLEQYYSLLDTAAKESLLDAYVPSSKIELRSTNPLIPSKIFEGQTGIQEFIASWPQSKHDHDSFDLKILSLLQNEGIAQVKGVCRFEQFEEPFHFQRTMKIIPFNAGLCCCSDLLEIQ